MSKWIRKGDHVLVISGNDKGKFGEVLKRDEKRVVVQGINLRKRHMKSRQQGQPSQILEIELPIHISNVALCGADGKPFKVRVKTQKNGTKKLVYSENDKEKTHRVLRKAKVK